MLSDCVSTDASASELFIVQMGVVASMAAALRDRKTQAVLAIDSTILEASKFDWHDLLDDSQVLQIVASLGAGLCLGHPEDNELFKIERLRYHKIILVTEDTVEGRYIRDQVVSVLYQLNYPVVAGNYVYLIPADRWGDMDESKFGGKVINSLTRHLVQVRGGGSMAETLALLGSTKSA
jgi:DNA gyrase subunit B